MSWIDDTQGAVKAGADNDFVVEGKPEQGTPVAARFATPVTKEANYFEITCVNSTGEGSAFVGLTSEGNFKPGYGLKACLFGGPGNLSSGIALVKGGFGKAVKTGTVVGVLVEFVEDSQGVHVDVFFYQDGKSLGKGFSADLKVPTVQLYPVVQASSDGDRFSCQFAPAPEGDAGAGGGHPAEGEWNVKALRMGADLAASNFAEIMQGDPLVFSVMPGDDDGTFNITFHCVNNCSFNVAEAEGRIALVGPGVARGRRGGPQPEMDLEGALCENLGSLSEWTAAPGSLLLKGTTIEVELVELVGGGDGSGKIVFS